MRRISSQILIALLLGLLFSGVPFSARADTSLVVSAQVAEGTASAPEETPGVISILRGSSTPVTANVSLSGSTSPGATVTVTAPGTYPHTVVADSHGSFSVVYDRLPFGEYVFSVSATDTKGMYTATTVMPLVLGNGVSASVSGIILGPTLSARPLEESTTVRVSGMSVPLSTITIWTDAFIETPFTVRADAQGAYIYDIDFTSRTSGVYRFRAKATVDGFDTQYGLPALLPVSVGKDASSDKNNPVVGPICDVHAGDFNCDGLINLLDFSILSFWYQKSNPPLRVDLTGDGVVDLADMSLLSCAGLCQTTKIKPSVQVIVRPVFAESLVGERIPVDIFVDTNGSSVNALSLTVDFPETLTYDGSSDADSILNAWIQKPHLVKGNQSILLSGMIPGGFSGYIDPFTPDTRAPGLLTRLYFKSATVGTVSVTASSITAYISDGKPTLVPVDVMPGNVAVVSKHTVSMPVLGSIDTTAPHSFVPRVVRDALLYEGKYTLVFTTADGESGIDYYEVQEGARPWVRAQSPYVLVDQRVSGPVKVRAVDHSGNSVTADALVPAVKLPPVPLSFSAEYLLRLKLFVVVCILAVLVLVRITRTL